MGKYSQAVISEDDRKASMGRMTHKSISKSNHATSTTLLMTGGMISLYCAAAEVQMRVDNDLGRGHNTLIGCSKVKC
jgi:hypothetical protein